MLRVSRPASLVLEACLKMFECLKVYPGRQQLHTLAHLSSYIKSAWRCRESSMG